MKLTIRKANAADAQAISELYAVSWKEAYRGIVPDDYLDNLSGNHWTDLFQKQLKSGELQGFAAESKGDLAGAVIFCPSRDERKPAAGEINSLYVHPDFYRCGCGTALLNAAKAALREQGYPEAFLWVVTGNERAMAFYSSCGLHPDGDILEVEMDGTVYTDLRYTIRFTAENGGGRIEKIERDKKRFLPLLLLADPSEEMVNRYLDAGSLFVLFEGERPVCEAVVLRLTSGEYELKNLATDEQFQCRGYAAQMLEFLFAHYRGETMLVGTSDFGMGYYQKNGFTYSHTARGFFTQNYPELICEDGRPCVDMQYLKKQL